MSKSMRLVACVIAISVLAIGGAFARTYFLPNYQAGLDGRVNKGGSVNTGGSCADYGYVDNVSSCTSPQILGNPINVYQGKTCYECTCPSKYRYGTGSKAEKCKYASMGERPIGDKCYSKEAGEYLYTGCGCPSNWISETDCEDQGYTGVGEGCFNRDDAWTYYESCGCPSSSYPLSSKPSGDGISCSSCTINGSTNYSCFCSTAKGYICTSGEASKFNCTSCERVCNTDVGFKYDTNRKTCTCNTSGGFVASGSGCVCDSSRGYISTGATPAACTCDTNKGWKGSRTCSAVACPTGYDNTVSSCSSSSSKPDLICNGWSGGSECCTCGCKNNSECDRTQYPLTAKPEGAVLVATCSTGCGDEKVTYYRATTCETGYTLTNGTCTKNEENITCEANGYLSNIPSGNKCSAVTLANGTKCFTDCSSTYCSQSFYTTTEDDLLRTESGEAVGFSYDNKNYILLRAEQISQTGGQFATCKSIGGTVPEVGMTSAINALATALPSGDKKTALTGGTPWLTSATTGQLCNTSGAAVGGGTCGDSSILPNGGGYCADDSYHALSNGGCFSRLGGGGSCMPNGQGTPLTVCVQDCSIKSAFACESEGYQSIKPTCVSLCSNFDFYSNNNICYEEERINNTTCYPLRTVFPISLSIESNSASPTNQGFCIENYIGKASIRIELFNHTTNSSCTLTEDSYCGHSNDCDYIASIDEITVSLDELDAGTYTNTWVRAMIQDPMGDYYALKIGG